MIQSLASERTDNALPQTHVPERAWSRKGLFDSERLRNTRPLGRALRPNLFPISASGIGQSQP
jgi:hypothetical protein